MKTSGLWEFGVLGRPGKHTFVASSSQLSQHILRKPALTPDQVSSDHQPLILSTCAIVVVLYEFV